MIRLILRDLFPSRATVGALRQRVHELERENKSLGEAYDRVNVYNRNLNEECDRLAAKILELERRAPNPTPFVPEIDGECPDRTCHGTLRWKRVGDCTCFIAPPCESCTSSPLVCDECGWRTE